MRCHVLKLADGVEFAIPAPRQTTLLIVLALWLCGWLPAGLHTLRGLFAEPLAGALWYELPWLAVWLLGMSASVYLLFWNMCGVQRVRATREQLLISNEMLRVRVRRHYRSSLVRDLRTLDAMALAGAPLSAPCRIGFDYGTRRIEFAAGIDRHEALRLVDVLTSLPWLDPKRNLP
jgi:hypothetical protein